ncbi:hypothetical protein FACS1894142_3870 [Spirochaetia bacterium]|nr:hypothetical protein FACS1894142_3870 [Spirochaetia bacterium]
MKKLIALFTVMAMVSATVFATPLSLAASLENGVPVKNGAVQDFDLFADVGATQLSDTEAAAVEGDGAGGALLGVVVGCAIVIVAKDKIISTGNTFGNTSGNPVRTAINTYGMPIVTAAAIIGVCAKLGSLLPF